MALIEKYEEALKILKSLSLSSRGECNVYFLMGRIYKKLQDKKNAILCFTMAQDHLSNKTINIVKDAIGKLLCLIGRENPFFRRCDNVTRGILQAF